jgi:hypothetical protein
MSVTVHGDEIYVDGDGDEIYVDGIVGLNGKPVGFKPTRKKDGEYRYEFSRHTIVRYDSTHQCHGRILVLKNGKPLCHEYEPTHEHHGEIHEYDESGRRARVHYHPTHTKHGIIIVFRRGIVDHVEYESTHERHGQIIFEKEDGQWRVEFAPTHGRYGQIFFFNNEEPYRLEYAPTHDDHGEITLYENRQRVRVEYTPPHKRAGETYVYENLKLVRTEFTPAAKLRVLRRILCGMGRIALFCQRNFAKVHKKHAPRLCHTCEEKKGIDSFTTTQWKKKARTCKGCQGAVKEKPSPPEESEDASCMVCFHDTSDEDRIKFHCTHWVCRSCVSRMFACNVAKACPMCRGPLGDVMSFL